AEVLESGERGGSGLKLVAGAAAVAALFKLAQTGFQLWNETAEWATGLFSGKTLFYVGGDLSPALVAVGYIVGLNIAVLVFLGGVLNFWVAIPILAWRHGGIPAGQSAADYALSLWSSQTRYLGVGAMVVGGLWALVRMRGSVLGGVRSGLEAYRRLKGAAASSVARTDRDMPMQWVLAALAASIVPLFLLYRFLIGHTDMSLGMAIIMAVFGFLFSAVSGYMTGLVGSSNNPVSGVTIATMLFASLLLLGVFGATGASGAAAAILIGAVVCCAAAIAGDNLHDLKTGHLVGATPWKQQVMLIVGVCAAALVMAPILNLLLAAYGIGPATPAHPNSLTAPQAALMAAVAKGVFEGGLPWKMVFLGMALAVAIIALDLVLEKRGSGFRAPVLAVAVGIYLPLELSTPIIAGGVVAYLVQRALAKRPAGATRAEEKDAEQRGILLSSGLIAGEALVGIFLAVPIVLAGRSDVLAVFGTHSSAIPGLLILALIVFGLHRLAAPRASRNHPVL
ncbi:MAG: oligopeptide transporter, OPT family, partial [Elusimicrobia bacterium]|nr:oligopeptide transporter, OPT family [Elusimicrobiota bacterium]